MKNNPIEKDPRPPGGARGAPQSGDLRRTRRPASPSAAPESLIASNRPEPIDSTPSAVEKAGAESVAPADIAKICPTLTLDGQDVGAPADEVTVTTGKGPRLRDAARRRRCRRDRGLHRPPQRRARPLARRMRDRRQDDRDRHLGRGRRGAATSRSPSRTRPPQRPPAAPPRGRQRLRAGM